MLRKAQKQKSKLRIGLFGPSGSGKTYSALLLAKGIAKSWSKVAIIDTENGSADLYSDLGDYSVLTLTAPFTSEKYIEALNECEKAEGIEVVIIDSISHEWAGTGGILETQEKLGGRYQDWATVKPRHRKLLDTIVASPLHIIATARSKQDYSMDSIGGKTKVVKVGLKQITEEGFEYELTTAFDININHLATVSKDRTKVFADKPEFVITEKTGQAFNKWAEDGAEVTTTEVAPANPFANSTEVDTSTLGGPSMKTFKHYYALLKELNINPEEADTKLYKKYKVKSKTELTEEQMQEAIKALELKRSKAKEDISPDEIPEDLGDNR